MTRDFCEDIIEYGRHNIIGNEQQFLAFVLSMLTCFAPSPKEYVSTFLVGESSGGKTHLQRTGLHLLPNECIFNITSSSDKAPIYSEDLRNDDKIKFIQFAEYQKLPPAVIEFLKSLSGDDDDFIYEVTNASKGNTMRIKHKKRPYSVTYAQVEIDHELESRVFVIPIMDNYTINRCVAAIKFGADEVEYLGVKYKLVPDEELEARIMDNIHSLMQSEMEVTIPFATALVDIVNHSKSVSKRHSSLISSLIKSSCRANWINRESVDGKLVANAQDVTNVLIMFDLLRATMMSIDIIDLTIFKKLSKEPNQNAESLIRFLQNMGLAELTKTELSRRLDKLYNENYIKCKGGESGNLYSGNDKKQILKVRVDWDEIYKHDSSPVKNVITGKEYSNIIEFGKDAEVEYEIRECTDDVSEHKQVNIKEATIRELVIDCISNSDNGGLNTSEIAYGILNNPDNQDKLDGIDYYGISFDIIPAMVDDGIIYYDDQNRVYKLFAK